MGVDWLNLAGWSSNYQTVVDRLNDSPFDELFEIDLKNDYFCGIYHVEGKYFVPVMQTEGTNMFRYATEHMIHPEDRDRHRDFMDPDTMAERLAHAPMPGILWTEARYRTVGGGWLWTLQVLVSGSQNGVAEGLVRCYIYDINTQKQREQGHALTVVAPVEAARRDDLTGLLPEREFFSIAQNMLPELSGQWCVMAVDIENFKLFCDWHGQRVGQFLLAGIGEILRRVEEETGGLAGYRGQDDFCLLLPYDTRRINDLYEELRALIMSQGDSVGFQPIFGICLIEDILDEITDLYNHAALTAEQTKGDFRNRVQVYNPDLYKKNAEEYQILAEFQHGLDNRELFFCLQPQCRVSTRKVVGAESLARWRTADGRMISPARFVPILEKYGMVTNLDKFMWEEVCKWLRRWIDAGHTPVPISVNVSQIDIFTIDVPAYFDKLLEKYRLAARLIKIEITESAYVEDTAVVKETVRRLRNLGFLVLMDDFGSGYSSLNMLSSLNVDVIKLDAQFLNINENEAHKGISILESIINMAKNMTIPVIVEGVETQEQTSFLADLGCRYMQGFYFYRPMPVEEFENLIRDERRIDARGFEFKANEQIHTREFLDENVFSDAMLNNILGPVGIYRWNGDNVDIIRYNQQFYRMVGIDINDLNDRRMNILEYLHSEDREKLIQLMERAALDRLNGAKGVVRVFKPNGVLCWISLQLYFMEENEQGMHFYGSSEDVTEMQYVNADIPGGYHRCAVDDSFEFYYISQGFQDMVGYTADEIREKFDNRFINMVHHDDIEIMRDRAVAIREGRPARGKPYRIKRKDDGYIYVVNQSHVTDRYGQLCFQSVAIDVTEVMKLRNQMRLLSRFSSDDVVFLRKKSSGWKYRVVIHGLEAKLGLSGKAFEKALDSGAFYQWIDEPERTELMNITLQALSRNEPFEFDFTVTTPGGTPTRLHMKTNHVSDKNAKVDYICMFREA